MTESDFERRLPALLRQPRDGEDGAAAETLAYRVGARLRRWRLLRRLVLGAAGAGGIAFTGGVLLAARPDPALLEAALRWIADAPQPAIFAAVLLLLAILAALQTLPES